jgi:hypothetical protein
VNSLLKFNILIGKISEISEFIPIGYYFFILLFSEKKIKFSHEIKIIIALSIFSFTTKLASNAWLHISSNNLFFYTFLGIGECLFLTLFFLKIFKIKRRTTTIVLLAVLLVNIALAVAGDPKVFNSMLWTANMIWLLILNLYYFYHKYVDISVTSYDDWPDSIFIVNAGHLLYFSSSFFVYLMGWYLLAQNADSLFANGWIIVSLAVIIKSSFYTAALMKAKKNG